MGDIKDFKLPKLPTKLELSLMYNLCYFKNDSDGWKDRKEIIKTNEMIKEKNENIYFSSDYANLHQILQKLIQKKLVEKKEIPFLDSKKIERRKKIWRLKKRKETLWSLWNIAGWYDLQEIENKHKLLRLTFLESNYFGNIPKKVKGKWHYEMKKAIGKSVEQEKKRLLNDYNKYKRALDTIKEYLKVYDIDVDKISNGGK